MSDKNDKSEGLDVLLEAVSQRSPSPESTDSASVVPATAQQPKKADNLAPPKLFKEPEVHDIVVGRGSPAVKHPGNIWFRELVAARHEDYRAAKRQFEKEMVAKSIIAEIENKNGHFLRKIDTSIDARRLGLPISAMGSWVCVDHADVMEKVKQALREKPESRRKRKEMLKKAAAATTFGPSKFSGVNDATNSAVSSGGRNPPSSARDSSSEISSDLGLSSEKKAAILSSSVAYVNSQAAAQQAAAQQAAAQQAARNLGVDPRTLLTLPSVDGRQSNALQQNSDLLALLRERNNLLSAQAALGGGSMNALLDPTLQLASSLRRAQDVSAYLEEERIKLLLRQRQDELARTMEEQVPSFGGSSGQRELLDLKSKLMAGALSGFQQQLQFPVAGALPTPTISSMLNERTTELLNRLTESDQDRKQIRTILGEQELAQRISGPAPVFSTIPGSQEINFNSLLLANRAVPNLSSGRELLLSGVVSTPAMSNNSTVTPPLTRSQMDLERSLRAFY